MRLCVLVTLTLERSCWVDIFNDVETFTAGRYGLKSIPIKQRGICLHALEWPAMPCMKWLPALGTQG